MKERVLFLRAYYGINIHSDAQGEFGEFLNTHDVFPDYSLLSAATIFNESDRYEVKVIDAVVENRILPTELLQKLQTLEFDLLMMKVSAPTIKSDLELIKEIKKIKPNLKIRIAGHTAKVLKNWLVKNCKDIDYVIEEPMDEYAYRYVHHVEGKVGINDLPCPDYTLVNYKGYLDDNKQIRLTLQASRSCPMHCSYCPYKMYYKNVEFRDVDKVFEDIKKLVDLGVDIIQFRDQYFTADKKRIRELCNKIIQSDISVRFICETRLDGLDKELVDLLRRAGVFLICFGVESGDDVLLSKYDSKKAAPSRSKEMIEYMNSLGIITMAFYIVGFPEDTWETLHKTYQYAEYLNSTCAIFNEYVVYHLDEYKDTISPNTFDTFQNTTNVEQKSNLTPEEKKYLVWLFSTMYTMKHDCLKKAYTYNYKIVENNKQIQSKIIPYAQDMAQLSEMIKRYDIRW